MKKKKQKNPVDVMLESVFEKLTSIPNFELVQTDELARKMYIFSVRRFGGIMSYKQLVSQTIVPAVNKANAEARGYIVTSKYQELKSVLSAELEENYHETLRLAYIGMFHKFENFMYELILLSNEIVKESGKSDLTKYAKEVFGYKFLDWHQSDVTYKINWIANCIKHKDGYPVKENPPVEFMLVDRSKRIQLTREQFISDVDTLVDQMVAALQFMKMFVLHQITFEDRELANTPEMLEKKFELENNIHKLIALRRARPGLELSDNLKTIIKEAEEKNN